MQDVQDLIIQAREQVRDHCMSLLSDAIYRGETNAKSLERQSAKISRALDKALHELKTLEKMETETSSQTDLFD